MLEAKVKRQIIHFYKKQPGKINTKELGRAIDWRLGIIRQLSGQVKRGLPFDDFQDLAAGLCLIQRQIEDELDLYQQDLQIIAGQLEEGEITEDEYQDKLELLTAAIFFLAYLSGSDSGDNPLVQAALNVLNSQAGDAESNAIITDQQIIETYIPDQEARNELDSELAIASVAGANLAAELAGGNYQDRQDSLFNRIGLWVTTAFGIYGLGQLYNVVDPFYKWTFGATEHCSDCNRLDGQIHRASAWRSSGWRPQGRSLECKGYNCKCLMVRSAGPSRGSF